VDGLNELLTRYFRDGDAAAMEKIVDRTRGRLLAAARRIGSPQDAEDSVQATYHALLRRGDHPLEAPLIAWLMTVVVRIAYRRKALDARQAQLAERLALPSDEAGPLRRAEHTERGELLRAEVARLPAKYRDVLVLRYFEGLSRADCAELLEIPEGTVKTQLRRGRAFLRGRLHPRLRHALWIGPWLFADTALSAPALGVAMKSKAGIVIVLIALLGLIGVATYANRDRAEEEIHRAEQPSDAVKPKAEPAPIAEQPEPAAPALRDSFDLASADRDRDVHGTVVDEDDEPIAGARIYVVTQPWRRANTMNLEQYHATEPGPSVRSARDGTFILPWKRGRVGELRIEAEGFARHWVDLVQAGERVRVVLDPGATVDVRVLGNGGKPAAGVRLVLRGSAGAAPGPFSQRTESDAAGRARFSGVSGNRLHWVVASSESPGQPGWARVEVPERGGTAEVEIRMLRPRLVLGSVTDARTGAAIEGATVGMGWSQRGAVVTDAEGRYELRTRASDGPRSMVASAPGFGAVQVQLGANHEVDIALTVGDRIRGRVVDAQGVVLEGVRIAALGTVIGERTFTSRAHAVSGRDGRFELGGLRQVLHVVAFLTAGKGRWLIEVAPAERPGGTVDVGDVVLPPGRSIEGRVLTAAGEPARRVSVTLSGANAKLPRIGKWPRRWRGRHATNEMRVTDDLGRFRFPDLAAGTYQVTVARAGGATMRRDVVLPADDDVTDVEIRFDATRTLSIEVVDPDGKGVPQAWFSITHGGGMQNVRTGPDGRAATQVKGRVAMLQLQFVSELPEDLAYELPVKRENIGPDVRHVRIELKRAGIVRGVVLLPDGKPVYKPLLTVRQGGRELTTTFGQEDGAFRAIVPATGAVEIVFKGHAVRGTRGTDLNTPYVGVLQGVTAGATGATLRLQPIAKDRSLTVRVVDSDGKPLAGMRVFTEQHKRFSVTDEEGRFRFTGLLAKPLLVSVFPDAEKAPGLVPPPQVSVVPIGQEVELRFLKGIALRGTVVRAAGSKGNVFIIVRGGQKALGTANCAADGRFEVFIARDAGGGPFTIQAIESATERGVAPRRAEVADVMLDGPEPRIEMK